MGTLKRLRMLLGTIALGASALPVGVAPAAADDFPYTYVEIQLQPGEPDGVASGINSSGVITGGWSLGRAWISDNGGPIQEIGTLGGCCSYGAGINDAGDVVGNAYINDRYEPAHAFLYHAGVMVDLGTGYTSRGASVALSVNSYLQAVGESYAPAQFTPRAILWQVGQIIDLGTLGGPSASARGINDSGQIVGDAQRSDHWHHAFLWENGVMQDLGTLGDDTAGSQAHAISSSGAIVGSAQSSSTSPSHAALWQNGTVTDLGTLPGSSGSSAYGVNNNGQVVGISTIGGVNHPFIWQDGVMQDLNDLAQLPQGLFLGSANAINDSGLIVGRTCSPITQCPPGTTVSPRAFLLVPNNPRGVGGGRAQGRQPVRAHR